MRVRSRNRSFLYRMFSIMHLEKLALLAARGYTIKGEGLSEDYKRHSPITILGAAFVFFGLLFGMNYFINLVRAFVPIIELVSGDVKNGNFLQSITHVQEFPYLNQSYLINFRSIPQTVLFCLISMLFSLIVLKKLSRRFDSLNHGQEGDARLATIKEVGEQYVSVPDKKLTYEGIGGFPVTHYHNKYFVDTNTVNSCIIGTSRSGKGETLVFPLTDIYSRATQKCSMIFNDPKGEIYIGSKETLEKRGYEVQVLNIINPDQSMSYNPLQLITDAYAQGDTSSAQMLVDQFSYALFNDPNAGQNKWVYSGAQKLLNGVILALIDYYVAKNDLGKITMYNVAQFIVEMTNRKIIIAETNTERTELDFYFDRLPQGHIAKAQYSSFSSMDAKNKAPIQSAVLEKLTIFQGFEAIAKMTSKNSFKLKSVGFPKSLLLQFDKSLYDKSIKVRFIRKGQIIGNERIRPNMAGVVDLNFNYNLKSNDQIEIEYQEQLIAYHIRLLEKDGELTYITGEFPELKNIELYYTEKPIAVFMITPDFDPSKNVLSSMFVKQLYTTLAQNCTQTRGNKCHRRVIMNLDEFGNMPAIESMDNIVTVCLGRNILFNLFLQSYTQLAAVYGENTAKIIKENCQNHVYIMSQDKDTQEEISKRVGERTVEKISRSEQEAISLNASSQINAGSERIIPPYKVGSLLEGEMIVARIHRQSKKRQKVRSFAIFSTKETAMPFRYEFLSEDFDPSGSMNDFDIPSEHKTFDLMANAIDIDQVIDDSIMRSSVLDLDGISDMQVTAIDEDEFTKVLAAFSNEEIGGYKQIVKKSLVDEEIDLLTFIKEAKNGDNLPLFSEMERIAFLQLANHYSPVQIYQDILNLVRLDDE